MNQESIAKKYGISPSVLSRVLNGRVNVQRLTAFTNHKLAKILNMTLDELYRAKPAKLKKRYFEMHELNQKEG